MPVVVSCQCGKQLRVPDEYVGRRVKCPACGQPQAVTAQPAAAAPAPAIPRRATPPPPPAPRLPAAPAGMIRFACGACGKQMQAKAEYAGQTTRCPACQNAVVISDPDSATVDARSAGRAVRAAPPPPPPMPARGRRDDDDLDDDDRRPARPRGRKKGGSALPWILAGVMLLLLAGGGLALFFVLRGGGGGGSDLSLVPEDARAIVCIRPADLLNTQLGKDALQQVPGAEQGIKEAQDKIGLTPSDIERVTYVTSELPPNAMNPHFLAIVSTSKPIDEKKVLDQMEKEGGKKPDEGTAGGKKYYKSPAGRGPVFALHFYSNKIVLMGTEAEVRKVLENGPRKKDGPLAPVLAKVGSNHIICGVNIAGMVPAAMFNDPQAAAFKVLADIDVVTVTANVAGNTAELQVTVGLPNDAKAKEAKDAFDGLKGMAKLFLPGFKPKGPANKDLAAEFDKGMAALESLTITQNGKEVQLKLKLDVDVKALANLAKMARF
jgi:hypothetical protein